MAVQPEDKPSATDRETAMSARDKVIRSIRESELDPNIIGLVNTLNSFDGVYTTGSCGGHENGQGMLPIGRYMVTFKIEPGVDGWFALEFLAWAVNNAGRAEGYRAELAMMAAAPYLNEPGGALYLSLEGEGEPNALARWLQECKRDCYVTPDGEAGPVAAEALG